METRLPAPPLPAGQVLCRDHLSGASVSPPWFPVVTVVSTILTTILTSILTPSLRTVELP